MNFKKLLKVISAIVAVAGVIAAVYIAIQKLTAHKEPEYFDDNDFFECDNEIEIVEQKPRKLRKSQRQKRRLLQRSLLLRRLQRKLLQRKKLSN